MENSVSWFVTSTCQMGRNFPTKISFNLIPIQYLDYSLSTRHLETVCGSQAEFYIQPINPCIDDIDILFTSINALAFDSDHLEIPESAGDLCDSITCFKFEEYKSNASFVRQSCQFGYGFYDWNLEKYDCIHAAFPRGLPRDLSPENMMKLAGQTAVSRYNVAKWSTVASKISSVTGPATTIRHPDFNCKLDRVNCFRFPIWPGVAKEWLNRKRHNGWPDSATVRKVIDGGCDVVQVNHRDIPKDPDQWRYSFSRSEVILIRSWTPTQQIVYHMLRFFAKREVIRKNCLKIAEIVCTYHLKTLMLWSCEEESTEWWETLSLVALCCKLCGKLCECLKKKHCINYFIPKANLLDHEMSIGILKQTIQKLDEFTEVNKMSDWFMTNYILPVYKERCNKYETSLTEEKIERCIETVCEESEKRRLIETSRILYYSALDCLVAFGNACEISQNRFKRPISKMPIKCVIDTTTLSKASNTLAHYFRALIMFQMSRFILSSKIQCVVGQLSNIWIFVIRQSYADKEHNYIETFDMSEGSISYFNRAVQIMKYLVLGYSKNESYFAKQVAILCLYKSLCCHDVSSRTLETASRLYLAALYCSVGECSSAVNLCCQVATRFEMNNNFCKAPNLKVNSLLFLDDVATIAGFLQLRRNILQMEEKNVLYLSPELFLHYLLFKSSSVRLVGLPKQPLLLTSTFEADYCLGAMLRFRLKSLVRFNQKTKTRIYSLHAEESTVDIVLPGNTDIAEALARISNDNMTRFDALLSEDIGKKLNLAPCYEALSFYRNRKYKDVLFTCEKILEEPERVSELEEYAFLNVNVNLPFIAYFDDDIQALYGFQLLVLSVTSAHNLANDFDPDMISFLTSLSVSSYLWFVRKPDELFNQILRQHFLANYLKLRCLMDLGFSVSEVKRAFRCLKNRFPLERILINLMLRKITGYCNSLAARLSNS